MSTATTPNGEVAAVYSGGAARRGAGVVDDVDRLSQLLAGETDDDRLLDARCGATCTLGVVDVHAHARRLSARVLLVSHIVAFLI